MSGETFGQMLRRFRIAAGMSQNELARQAGVDAALVNGLEAGKSRRLDGQVSLPRRTTVLAFVEVLDVSQAEADRMLHAADHATQADWQTRAEVAEAKLKMIVQTLDAPAELLIFPRRRTG